MAVTPDVKERLKADGVWKAFCDRRDEHKASGDLPRVAQHRALAEFYRPDDATSLVGENSNGKSQA